MEWFLSFIALIHTPAFTMTTNSVIHITFSVCLLLGYVLFRFLRYPDLQLNILNLTIVLIVGQFVRNKNTIRYVVPSVLRTMKVGLVADAIFTLKRNDLAASLIAIIALVWIMVPAEQLYVSGDSRVHDLSSPEDIASFTTTNQEVLLLCCDFRANVSERISHVFADLSCDKAAVGIRFGLIDSSQSGLVGKLKLANASVPTIIQYANGKEVARQQLGTDASFKALKLRFFPYR